VLCGAAGIAAALLGEEAAAQQPSPAARARPDRGDKLVFAAGDKQGEPIRPVDLPLGGPQMLAWAMDPQTSTLRNASRLNQVLLIRLDPAQMDEETAQRAAEGIVAYSAICTHAQCPVSEWQREKNALHCPCHQSEFDPGHGGRVVGGPAPRPLPILPIAVEDGVLVVAGRFVGRVGGVQG